MAKPSSKKASKRTAKPKAKAKAKAPASKPAEIVEDAPKVEDATPAPADAPGPATVIGDDAEPVPPAAEIVDAEPEAEQSDDAPAEMIDDAGANEATVAPVEMATIGGQECRAERMPVDEVLGLLTPEGVRRVEAQQSSPTFEATCKRLAATDGRATPVVFEEGSGELPQSILHGYEELAAAVASGAETVTVLTIPAGGAAEAQAHIVEMVRQQRAKATQTSDDDELFWRVNASE